MKVQVLFASMYQKDNLLPLRSNVVGNYLVINQTDYSKYPNITNTDKTMFLISTEERGLSNSRNMAIKYATGDICLIADDDIEYLDGYENIVKNAYKKYPDADIILFDFLEKNSIRKRKPVAKCGGELNYLQILRGNSVRISFKLKSIKENHLKFNTYFGAGSNDFTSGEDIVFLVDSFRKKLKIYYEPIPILKLLDNDNSTWFNGFNEQYFNNIGAFSCHYANNFWFVYCLQFLLRHITIVRKSTLKKKQIWIELKKGVLKYKKMDKL